MSIRDCDVPFVDFEDRAIATGEKGEFLTGGMSSGWCEPLAEDRRRIGFRMPEPEAYPDDPRWWL